MTKKTGKDIVSAPENALTFSSDDFDADVYASVARKARLQDLRLCESNYFSKPECFMEAEETGKELSQGFYGEMSGHSFSSDSGLLVGGYVWGADVRFGRKKALKMKCEYVLIYSGLEGADAEYVRLYFKKIARFTSYPYFRAHFAHHSAASGLRLPPLPSLNDRMD
ncbi:hypothetical protein [Acidimangrovimonas pyrenivorans]|uniref:Uncharacterized protein n=1 Tax=Acidimangrovimonas pyrenivorans TaxID=2030798 RepID=A0ABV7AFN4_9RHOB